MIAHHAHTVQPFALYLERRRAPPTNTALYNRGRGRVSSARACAISGRVRMEIPTCNASGLQCSPAIMAGQQDPVQVLCQQLVETQRMIMDPTCSKGMRNDCIKVSSK